ncbi:arginine repressor [soil metagenome]
MIKVKRQQAIINLIIAKNIATQEQLTKALIKVGFSVTQSSVSRDLDELGIIKVSGFYAMPNKSNNARFGFLDLETAGENLIIARCESGLASAVAVQIDRAKIIEIVGTIAGDDTIFIAVENKDDQKQVIKKVWEVFESK